jgi:AcrR family transcriptional regulator
MARKIRTKPMEAGERRKQLLAVARKIIAAEGLGGLTMESLAARADVSKPVVYALFADRQEVALALMHEHYRAINTFTEERLGTPTTLEAYIRKMAEAGFAFARISDTPIYKIVHGFSAGDAVNQYYLRQEQEFQNHWKRLLVWLGVAPAEAALAAIEMRAMALSTMTIEGSAKRRKLAEETHVKLLLSVFAALGARKPLPADLARWVQRRKAELRKLRVE